MESPLADVRLHLVQSIDDLDEMRRWAGERRDTPLGVDVETSGLDIGRHQVRLIQLGDLHHGWSVPWELWGGGALEILKSYKGDFVGHNIPFDVRFIRKCSGFELPWHKIHDTLLLGAIDDPARPRGLKPLADLLIDRRASAGQQTLDDGMRENGWDWGTVPVNFTPFWVYGALDPVLTCHIWKQLHPRVQESCPQVYDLERGTSRVVSRMMETGMMTDRAYILEKITELKQRSEEIRVWLALAYNISTPNSGPQVARAFASLGYQISTFTATGLPQVDKKTLEYIGKITDDPAIRDLARSVYAVRHMERVIGGYLENFLEMADADGVIRPQIWTLTARTSRMSITEPALQTLSRSDKAVRGAFIPRTGYALISIDADQIEARLGAALSGDEGLILAFKNADAGGQDFYSGMASEIFGEVVYREDPRRQATKNVFYARMYGAGVDKMAITAGISYDEAKALNDRISERYPGLEQMARRIANQCYEQKYRGKQPVIYTPFGRRLPVDKPHAGVNYTIQAHAAEILKRSMLNLEAAGFGEMLRLPVHDEIILECKEDDAEQVLAEVTEVLTDRDMYPVTISWGGKVMRERWSK